MGIDSAPTVAPGPLYSQAALVFAFVLAAIQAVAYVSGLGEFQDGIQVQDVILVVTTLLAGLATKAATFSQKTVDQLAPRSKQRQVIDSQ